MQLEAKHGADGASSERQDGRVAPKPGSHSAVVVGAAEGESVANSASAQPHGGAGFAKLLIELGPLVVFFATNYIAGRALPDAHDAIFWGTGAFMVATVLALAVSRLKWGRLPVMPLVSGALVLVFGALTLYLKNEVFIMVKPTILYSLFAVILFVGLWRGMPLLKYALGATLNLTEAGWRQLTVRWAVFFVFLAILNELVWRTQSADFWVKFKLFGFLPLTVAFAVAQTGLMRRHELPADAEPTTKD